MKKTVVGKICEIVFLLFLCAVFSSQIFAKETGALVQQAGTAVSAALAGARQVGAVQRIFADYATVGEYDTYGPTERDKLLRYEDDPLGCLAGALMQTGSTVCSEVGLADLNFDGVPELLLDYRAGSGASYSVCDISDGKLVELVGINSSALQEITRVYDAEGRVGICLLAGWGWGGMQKDQMVYLFYDKTVGWDVWIGECNDALDMEWKVERFGNRTTIYRDGRPVIDPGDNWYRKMLECPAQWYTNRIYESWQSFRNTGFIAWVANDSNPNDGMSYVDISQQEAAWEMAGKLLDAWQNFEPVEPVAGYTVYDILTMDYDM